MLKYVDFSVTLKHVQMHHDLYCSQCASRYSVFKTVPKLGGDLIAVVCAVHLILTFGAAKVEDSPYR